MKTYKDIDSYIEDYPKDVQSILKKLRATIKKAAPNATEAISYGIPTFKLNGNLVHFGGFEKHIGLYPGSGAIKIFKKDLLKYKGGKGTIQFPIDEPLPFDLITKIVKLRVTQNLKKAKK
ncbi:DUF1801 domain-containing protein [Acetobacteraceae bacterium]|nr:DUF1801 domain-containing protein [Candidatus Parcubacteria bacterium]